VTVPINCHNVNELATGMGEIAKLSQKSNKKWFNMDWVWYDMKMTILGKIYKFWFWEHFSNKIVDMNGHN